MPPVKEADPAARDLGTAFAEAMATPPKPAEAPPPPEIDPDAPHGRHGDGTPKAPYGYTRDGAVRKTAAGRPRKDDAARTVPAAPDPPPPPGPAALEPRDFSAPLMDFSEAAWFGGSILAKIGPQIPVAGKLVFGGKLDAGRKLAATMAVFDAERPRLAAALNLAAQHDARARRLAAKLADGDAGWALTCMFMVAPFTGAVAAVWQTSSKHDALAEQDLPGLDELAKRNEAALDRMFTRISAQMEAAQLAAQAAALADGPGAGDQLAA